MCLVSPAGWGNQGPQQHGSSRARQAGHRLCPFLAAAPLFGCLGMLPSSQVPMALAHILPIRT